MLFRADAFRPAYDDFARALAGDPHDAGRSRACSGPAPPRSATPRRVRCLAGWPVTPPTAKRSWRFPVFSRRKACTTRPLRVALGLVQADGSNVAALEQMASVLSDAGDKERMAPVVARLRAQAPGSEAAHYYSAALLYLEGRTDLALT